MQKRRFLTGEPIVIPKDSDADAGAHDAEERAKRATKAPKGPGVDFALSIRIPKRDMNDPEYGAFWLKVRGKARFKRLLLEMVKDGDLPAIPEYARPLFEKKALPAPKKKKRRKAIA